MLDLVAEEASGLSVEVGGEVGHVVALLLEMKEVRDRAGRRGKTMAAPIDILLFELRFDQTLDLAFARTPTSPEGMANVSGCFRSAEGANAFAVSRSYISPAAKTASTLSTPSSGRSRESPSSPRCRSEPPAPSRIRFPHCTDDISLRLMPSPGRVQRIFFNRPANSLLTKTFSWKMAFGGHAS